MSRTENTANDETTSREVRENMHDALEQADAAFLVTAREDADGVMVSVSRFADDTKPDESRRDLFTAVQATAFEHTSPIGGIEDVFRAITGGGGAEASGEDDLAYVY